MPAVTAVVPRVPVPWLIVKSPANVVEKLATVPVVLFNVAIVPVVLLSVATVPVVLFNVAIVPVVLLSVATVPVVLFSVAIVPVVLFSVAIVPVVLFSVAIVPVVLFNVAIVPVVLFSVGIVPVVIVALVETVRLDVIVPVRLTLAKVPLVSESEKSFCTVILLAAPLSPLSVSAIRSWSAVLTVADIAVCSEITPV